MLEESSVVLFSAFALLMSTSLPINDNQTAFQCCKRKLRGVLFCLLGLIASASSMLASLPFERFSAFQCCPFMIYCLSMLPSNDMLLLNVVGESSVVSFSAFWVTAAALGATVLAAWGGYGKNSDTGLSLKRVGPLPAVKVPYLFCFGPD